MCWKMVLFFIVDFKVEMIAAYLNKTPEEIALATTFNALKVFGLSAWCDSEKKVCFISNKLDHSNIEFDKKVIIIMQ